MIEMLMEILSTAIINFMKAGDDRAKQEEALMAAEEKLSRMRAKAKFGAG